MLGVYAMKSFTSIGDVSLDDLLNLLDAWEVGSLVDWQVQAWAERISEGEEWPLFDPADPRAALADVIQLLDLLYGQHILRQDIPALREYLATYQRSPDEASQSLDEYWARVPLEERRKLPRT